MRLKTETRNTKRDASVNDDDKKERTHQTPARTASYPHKYIVLHLAILTSVDGVKWAGQWRNVLPRNVLILLLSGRLVLGFVAGFVLGCRPPLNNTFYISSPIGNAFCQHFIALLTTVVFRSFLYLLIYANGFSPSRKVTGDQVMSQQFKHKIERTSYRRES